MMALHKALRPSPEMLQSAPQLSVMKGAHKTAAVGQPREDLEKSIDGHVGHLGVSMDNLWTVSQIKSHEPEWKSDNRQALKEIVKAELWHDGPVIANTMSLHLSDKSGGKGRMGTNHFYYMTLHCGRYRLSYVEGHPLGTAQIEMGDDMKYPYRLILHNLYS